MIAVTIDKPGMKIVRKLLVKAKELEESELSGFGRGEIQDLKRILRELISHCEDRVALDKRNETSRSPARTA